MMAVFGRQYAAEVQTYFTAGAERFYLLLGEQGSQERTFFHTQLFKEKFFRILTQDTLNIEGIIKCWKCILAAQIAIGKLITGV